MRTYYTIEFKLKVLVALDANNGNIFRTAQQFGIPRQTLSNWIRDRETIFEESATLGEERRLPLSRRLSLMINQIADSLPEKVEKAQLGDATRALSLLIDLTETLAAKEAAKRERSDELEKKLARLYERYTGRSAEAAAKEHEQWVDAEER